MMSAALFWATSFFCSGEPSTESLSQPYHQKDKSPFFYLNMPKYMSVFKIVTVNISNSVPDINSALRRELPPPAILV